MPLLEQLFENLALEVQPFASCHVARGWRLQLPLRDWVILHFVLRGDGGLRAGTEQKRYPLSVNTLALIPPSLVHGLESGTDIQREASVRGDEPGPICRFGAGPAESVGLVVACGRIQVTYGGGPGLFGLLKEPLVLDFSVSPQMRAIFESLIDEHGELGSAAMMNALMNQCLIAVFRRIAADPDCPLPWLSALEDPSLARVLSEILERPERHYSVDMLAHIAVMSRSVFAEKFQSCFHRTPMDYLRDVRLRRAAQLLHRGDLSVGEVATKVGFSSRSHFSRIFNEQFGRSPVQFRAEAH
jgi:AraC family transcriptional activator of mtrCDE